MTLAQTSIRTAAKQRLVELLTSALPDAQVSYGWPGKLLELDSVFVGNITDGQVTPKSMTTGRKPREDVFTVTVHCMAAVKGRSCLESEQAVELLYAALENVCAEYPTLNDLPGVVHAVQNGSTVGPESDLTTEGYVSFIDASVQVRSYLR